ncbi:hypothetical protein HPB48_017400 [Haemaphysalis longicornis]|uniref:BTB domain-containing protein n=1 Tax=Haemaphysalis longicornis TaxID=44386 RepID=A0A9J6GJ60_HAELO|nr:hypothetical protein HPB48_017400 [Haemaphysalis longicornis]
MAEQSRTTTAQQSEGNAPVDQNWCHTRIVVSKHCYRWTIHDFCCHGEKMGDTLQSSTFSTGTDGKLTWRLELCRDGKRDELGNLKPAFSVVLRLVSCQLSHVDVACRMSVLDGAGVEAATKFLTGRLYPRVITAGASSDESGQYFDVGDAVAPDDTLTIRCEMDVFVGPVNVPGEKKEIAIPEGQLSSDLGHLFEDGKYSDVVLNVQGQEIRAHKMILSARSVVFASMFEHDMEETKKNLVEITDLDYETMRRTVRFMYTDQAPDIDAKAEDLLVAADKYGLDRLKALCEKALCSKVCAETAATLLFLADMHSADQLKRFAMGFVKTHVKDVMVTSGWKTLTQRRPQLIDEVFRAFAIERCLRETCQQD